MVSGPRGQGERDPRPNAMDNYYGFGRGLDVRNPGDFALQRAQSYPSNRQPLLNQPPMEGPPQSQQRPHVNPRMRHINPRGMNQNYGGKSTYPHELQHQGMPRRLGPPSNIGYDRMGGGLGGLQEQAAVAQDDWRTWDKIIKAGGNPDDYETQTAYNVGDTYPLEGKGGYGTRGPFTIAPHDIQELETIPLDMQFDQWGNPIGGDDYGYFDDTFAARGGLMSLRR